MSATGRGAMRDPLDRYDTPPWCVDRLLDALFVRHELGELANRAIARRGGSRWLEPAVGSGAIVGAADRYFKRLRLLTPSWESVDIRPRGSMVGVATRANFLTSRSLELRQPDVIISNPSYQHALAFILRSLALQPSLVAMLMRLNWIEGASQMEPERAALLRDNPPDVFVLPQRPHFHRNGRALRNRKTGEPIKGSDATAYAWFTWGLTSSSDAGRWFLLDETPAEDRRLLVA